MPDVVIVGGGVIGLSIAHEIAGHGACVKVLEQGRCGREASWAGAGMLPPGNRDRARTCEAALRALSCELWPGLSEELLAATGIDNGYRRCGGIDVGDRSPGDAAEVAESWYLEGVEAHVLRRPKLFEREPNLNPSLEEACYLPEMAQVRNPRHLKALLAGCRLRDVRLREGEPAVAIEAAEGRVRSLRTPTGEYSAEKFVVAGGAWTGNLLAQTCPLPIVPVRGQIALLQAPPGFLNGVIETGPRYLVPRADGRVLVGSTEERCGFQKRTTAAGIRGLLNLAIDLVPKLSDAEVERTWAGLRPRTPDGLPVLGRVAEYENLYVAAGHFRAGLQLSPGTAKVMGELLAGETPCVSLDDFAVDRFFKAESGKPKAEGAR